MSGGDQNVQQASTIDDGDVSDVPSTSTGVTRPRPPRGAEALPSVTQNVARLRECEDYNMALALQEAEFSEHYRHNRTERQTAAGDFQTSVEEQRRALEAYLTEAAEIAERDAELARMLQSEIEAEEVQARQHQARLDEEFARRLQLEEEQRAGEFGASAVSTSLGGVGGSTDNGNQRSGLSPILEDEPQAGSSGLGDFHSAAIRADPPSYAECMTMTLAGGGEDIRPPPPRFSDGVATTGGAASGDLMEFGGSSPFPASTLASGSTASGPTAPDACQRNAAAVDALLLDILSYEGREPSKIDNQR